MWERYEFKPGDLVARANGAWGEVLSVSKTGDALRIRYTGDGGDPSMAGTEDLVATSEVLSLSPAPAGPGWGKRVGVVVHHAQESADGEASYGAVTMSGVPLGVSIEATDADTAREALDRLLGALAVFGYRGVAAVRDVTEPGTSEEYEVDVG